MLWIKRTRAHVIAQQVEKSSIFHNFIFEYFLLTIIIRCISVHPL